MTRRAEARRWRRYATNLERRGMPRLAGVAREVADSCEQRPSLARRLLYYLGIREEHREA